MPLPADEMKRVTKHARSRLVLGVRRTTFVGLTTVLVVASGQPLPAGPTPANQARRSWSV